MSIIVWHRQKKLKFLEEIRRQEVYALIRDCIDLETGNIQELPQNQTPNPQPAENQGAPLAKIPRFMEYEDSSDSETEENVQKHELD